MNDPSLALDLSYKNDPAPTANDGTSVPLSGRKPKVETSEAQCLNSPGICAELLLEEIFFGMQKLYIVVIAMLHHIRNIYIYSTTKMIYRSLNLQRFQNFVKFKSTQLQNSWWFLQSGQENNKGKGLVGFIPLFRRGGRISMCWCDVSSPKNVWSIGTKKIPRDPCNI